MVNKKFAEFMNKNISKAYTLARGNTSYDAHGHVSIDPNGDIAKDVFWDDYFEMIEAYEGNQTTRSVEGVLSV